MVTRLAQRTNTRPSDHFRELMDLSMTPAEALILDIYSFGSLASRDQEQEAGQGKLSKDIQREWDAKDKEYQMKKERDERARRKTVS